MPRRPVLSKSSFIRGQQCLKSLYLAKKHPGLQDPVSEGQQAVFDRGHTVGELACRLFPGGALAAYDLPEGFMRSMYRTRNLIEQKQAVIYEAGLMAAGTHCFVDILVRDGDQWKVFEVKSSTKISDVYLYDAAFQYHVLKSAGLGISDISIIYINNQYMREGDLDIRQLFITESVLDRVLEKQAEIREQIEQEVAVLQKPTVPNIPIGRHCFDPYPCDFMGHCWQHVPTYSVFDVAHLSLEKKFDLYSKGILDTRDIPPDYPLSDAQRLQAEADRSGEAVKDIQGLRSFLDSLNYPLYFLDFETFNPAVPLYDRSRPYQQLIFQYSLHIQDRPGGPLRHTECLAHPATDPRIEIMDRLVDDIGSTGDIIVYNKGFEAGRLKETAADFPRFGIAVEQMLGRMVDLMAPFQQKHFYTPAMQGSYSIKYVLPALVPGFSYSELEISHGEAASLAYAGLLNETDPAAYETVRRQLLAYCRTDTLAMAEILQVIRDTVKDES